MKFRLKHKILLFLLLPVSALIYFTLSDVKENYKNMVLFNKMQNNLKKIVYTSKIIHEVQKERGRTSFYLMGSVSKDDLNKYRKGTDNAFATSQRDFASCIDDRKFKDLVENVKNEIIGFRSRLELNKVTFKQSNAAYTQIINKMFTVYSDGLSGPTTQKYSEIISGIYAIEKSKEYLGLFRGFNAAFVSGSLLMSDTELGECISYREVGSRFVTDESLKISDDARRDINVLRNSEEWGRFNNFYLSILNNHRTGNYGIDTDGYFDVMTKIIDRTNNILSLENDGIMFALSKDRTVILRNIIISVLISLFVTLFMFIGGYVFAACIAVPLNKTILMLEDISHGEGDLTAKIIVNTNDEVKLFADNFNRFTGKLRDIISAAKLIGDSGLEISKNLALNAEESSGTIKDINLSMASMIEKTDVLDKTIKDASVTTGGIIKSLMRIVNLIEDQASSVAQSSASVEEMVASIANITKVTSDRKSYTDELTQKAVAGEDGMNETLVSITDMSQKAEVIFELIGVINEVAEKTDLLAMNAAIEAAHAGESGKGFAVVADEIRNLAEATKQKSAEISKSLNEMSAMIKNTLSITKKTGTMIHEIITGIIDLSNTMNEMLNSMNEMKIGSDQIIIALKSLINITDEVKDASTGINTGAVEIESVMGKINLISSDNRTSIQVIADGIGEMSDGLGEIALYSENNANNSIKLNGELGKFKT